jgi:hypothetical protein
MQIQLGTFVHVKVFNIISNEKNFLGAKQMHAMMMTSALFI